MKRPTAVLAAGLLALSAAAWMGTGSGAVGLAAPGAGGDARLQLRTAITHAGFAASGSTRGYVERHLGHALNCLEGTKGTHFNQAWGHVCEGQGSGILSDLKATPGGADVLLLADHAAALAVAGVKSRQLAEARNAARGVAALLSVAADALK